MGASCVRECERTAAELYASEDALPVQASMPGLSSIHPPGPGGQASVDVKVGTTFANPLAAINGNGGNVGDLAGSGNSPPGAVPPVYGLKALRENMFKGSEVPVETPRFDEVTPRGGRSVAGEYPTGTPGASPRDSPRSPDEGRQDPASQQAEISYEGGMSADGLKEGTGRLRMNGSTYEGEFLQDLKHGQGVLTWDDGRQYRGQFEGGKFHGTAVMTWPDGRKYCGQYIEDRKHGEGTFSWQDGRRYQGQWVVGKRHGIGVYTNAKGFTRTGMWQMDRPLHWEAVAAQTGIQGLPPTMNGERELPSPKEDRVSQQGLITIDM